VRENGRRPVGEDFYLFGFRANEIQPRAFPWSLRRPRALFPLNLDPVRLEPQPGKYPRATYPIKRCSSLLSPPGDQPTSFVPI